MRAVGLRGLKYKIYNLFTNFIFANYIKDNLSLIYTNIFAFKPLYYKKFYLLGTILINIMSNNRNNSIVV